MGGAIKLSSSHDPANDGFCSAQPILRVILPQLPDTPLSSIILSTLVEAFLRQYFPYMKFLILNPRTGCYTAKIAIAHVN
jgi:hypothetical protein